MVKSITDCTVLNNGVKMPWLGLGVWKVDDGAEVENAVKYALEAGYISIDTAAAYQNEEGVGKAIRESGIPRENLFVTTKLWNANHEYEVALKACDESLRKLGMDYVDLYLIHWPIPSQGKYKEAWRALIKLQEEGKVRAIGVSNFHIHHLKDIIEDSGVVPAVNQVECHPWLSQKELLAFCRENNIQMQAYSPLMSGHLDEVEELKAIAQKYGKSPAQVAIRWQLQNEVVTIPKSVRKHRIIENADVFDFSLTDEDMKVIDGLNRNHRFLPDPDVNDFLG